MNNKLTVNLGVRWKIRVSTERFDRIAALNRTVTTINSSVTEAIPLSNPFPNGILPAFGAQLTTAVTPEPRNVSLAM